MKVDGVEVEGVWVIYYYDWHRFPVAVFPGDQELETRRFQAQHYMRDASRVAFWPFGMDWNEWDPDDWKGDS